jgi:hypothetical protein|uniref:Uncharacterized protein n=1 Tax=virus sp. ctPYc18 TaxID=2828251 RepID=A0A8S5RCK2_9VIRU|nr:MAG TPA: hypothetical protein [virus sp. ctPYc18]
MNKYLIAAILILSTVLYFSVRKNVRLGQKYDTSMENIKAYDKEMSGLKD